MFLYKILLKMLIFRLILIIVDWAALAQQWIQMKESIPANAVQATAAPLPLPVDSKSECSTKDKGEAPMDVENDEKETGWIIE